MMAPLPLNSLALGGKGGKGNKGGKGGEGGKGGIMGGIMGGIIGGMKNMLYLHEHVHSLQAPNYTCTPT
jgi:hypothetical protein